MIGIAPSNIKRTMKGAYRKSGYYLDDIGDRWSGPPFNYSGVQLSHMNSEIGSIIKIELDLDKGILSFSHNGKNFGVAYSGIPRDQSYSLCLLTTNDKDEFEIIR